jgi:hypothetical protein
VQEIHHIAASRDQRVQAALIDHSIDSTLWVLLAGLTLWVACHLQAPLDLRTFVPVLVSEFPQMMMLIGLVFGVDLLLGLSRGQTIGQLIIGTYKYHEQKLAAPKPTPLQPLYFWLHGLLSRCLGLPLLLLTILLLLSLNPTIAPIHLSRFSLTEPVGTLLLLVFLLKIIGGTLLLFAVHLPTALGFFKHPLPTWYDRVLSVHVLIQPSRLARQK